MQAPTIESSPTTQPRPDVSQAETAEVAWKPLYRIGAVAALISVAIVFIAAIVFIVWPPPSFQPTTNAVIDWFKFFQDNAFLGLLDLDLGMLVGQALSVLIMLALYVVLRRVSPSFTAIALAFSLMGAVLYFAANQAFSMLFLSGQYAAATTDAQRASFATTGQTLLTIYQGTPFDVSYILGAIATLIFSAVMLRSAIFGKATAYVGILTGVLMLVPANAGTLGLILSLLSLVPLIIWDILIACKLFQLGNAALKAQSIS